MGVGLGQRTTKLFFNPKKTTAAPTGAVFVRDALLATKAPSAVDKSDAATFRARHRVPIFKPLEHFAQLPGFVQRHYAVQSLNTGNSRNWQVSSVLAGVESCLAPQRTPMWK
jgi:hypothetical protein